MLGEYRIGKILAPLRGVTIRCFRESFAEVIHESGFTEAITPFIPALPGLDPLKDRELLNPRSAISDPLSLRLTPQFIGKDPQALRMCLERIKDAGYDTADLNCGCPFPMVRNKGRGSGILRTPDVLRRMLDVGCSTMGDGGFSVKARLGVTEPDELLKLMPLINDYPLRFLTVHARTARQMYGDVCDTENLKKVCAAAKVPVVLNGDIPYPVPLALLPDSSSQIPDPASLMIGRSFIRYLGTRDDIGGLLSRYIKSSRSELSGDRPVLGRMKELISYWKDLPQWRRRWGIIKLCRSVDELRAII